MANWRGVLSKNTFKNPEYVIKYTSTDGKIVTPYSKTAFGNATIISNTYEDGVGYFKFDSKVTFIDEKAFSGKTTLQSIEILDSVLVIGASAFTSCKGLTSLTLGNSVTSIGNSAFYQCSRLTSIINNSPYFTTIYNNKILLSDNSTKIIASAPASLTGSLIIPDSVTSIGDGAFYSCSGLSGKLVIPDSVTSIGSSAFYSCSKLTSLTLGNSVTSIGSYAFRGCGGLTGNLVIPDSVTSIGSYAFYKCSKLTSIKLTSVIPANISTNSFPTNIPIYVPDNLVTLYKSKWSSYSNYIQGSGEEITGSTVIRYTTTNGSIITPPSIYVVIRNEYVNGIGELEVLGDIRLISGFSSYTTLQSIEIPDGVTSISNRAFYSCSGLTSLTLGSGVTSIGDYAFSGCKGLTGELIIPDSVTSIGDYAFYQCYGITSLTLGNSVTSIGETAFYQCYGLTGDLVIPDSVTSIGDSAFYGCSGLTSLIFGNSVISIGDSVFYNCSKLTSLTLGNSVTSIGETAFGSCSSLTSIINNSPYFTTIYNNKILLSDNSTKIIASTPASLTGSLVIPDSVTSIGNDAFYRCSGLTGDLIIPDSVTSIGDGAFYQCSKLTSLTFGNGVTSIGNNAFSSCSSLTSITCKSPIAPSIYSYTFYQVKNGGILYYPLGSDYSKWLSTASYYLGYYKWTGAHKYEPQVYYDLRIKANDVDGRKNKHNNRMGVYI